jgi:5-methyltetrahydrofolate--homocysteine methyltransferase
MALACGLDMPIINPDDRDMTDAVLCYHLLKNIDAGSVEYIKRFGAAREAAQPKAEPVAKPGFQQTADAAEVTAGEVMHCVLNGLKAETVQLTAKLLESHSPMEVVGQYLMPALDEVGKRYETGEIFLPQLLSSAEAAKAAFELVRQNMPASESGPANKIILATVKGDIHDIGKNIVAAVLENYGYGVIDLGKDVEGSRVAAAAAESGAKLVGLSALMTTTLEAMERTVALVKRAGEDIAVMVGGAVLTEAYAKKIGADYYAADAMAAVGIAKKVFGS